MGLIHLNTCVYLDCWQDRKDKLRPLGEFAFQLIRRAIQCEFEVVVSNWVVEELEGQLPTKEVAEMLYPLYDSGKAIKIKRAKEDGGKARALSANWTDALHVVLAKKAGTECIITRNLSDFAEFQNLLPAYAPEYI